MKNITIAGRCTKDAQLRRTNDGTEVAGFSVAVDDGYGQNKSALFFECSCWGKRGASLAPMLMKGKQVTVSGDLGTREYNDKTYLTIRVADVTLQGGGNRDSGAAGDNAGHSDTQSGYGAGGRPGGDMEDEIPFNKCWEA